MGLTYDIEKDALYQKGRNQGKLEGIELGVEKGIEKGREEGEFKKAVATAEKCLRKGMSLVETAELTDLPLAEVKKIAQRLKG